MKNKMIFLIAITFSIASACQPSGQWPANNNGSSTQTLESPTQPPATEITDDKGVTMRLVPAGEFTMGSKNGGDYEKPVHKVYLDSYYIDQYEVTIASYNDCANAGVCAALKQITDQYFAYSDYYTNPGFNNYPVLENWDMAKAYCEWRGNGTRLPTEAEWEKAARGTDGRSYPWREGGDYAWMDGINNTDANFGNDVGAPSPVGTYKHDKSVYGIYDMAGNASEWVNDWYSKTYYQDSPYINPLGPASGEYHVYRGGAWGDFVYNARATSRKATSLERNPSEFQFPFGFRCARPLSSANNDNIPTQPAQAATLQPTATLSPTVTQAQQPTSSTNKITDTMGMVMRRVPAGNFTTDNGHQIFVDAYDIDQYEVTNELYKDCVDDGICIQPKQTYSFTHTNYYGNSKFNNYPVLYVDWYMARTFCDWRGARLPTDAEWEIAARSADERTYPWGEDIDNTFANYNRNQGDTTAVGGYEKGKSRYGVYDMAGNVWEWTANFIEHTHYWREESVLLEQESLLEHNLVSDDIESYRWIRGGSWHNDEGTIQVASHLSVSPNYANLIIGFRCARSIPPDKHTGISTPPPEMTSQPDVNQITDDKGVVMRLVPAGEFTMGSEYGAANEKPIHQVYLDLYYIDQYEVTNALYKACAYAGVCRLPDITSENHQYFRDDYYRNPKFDNYPAVSVSWSMAKAYCVWRGARLPTEAEWEKAARGTDGQTYPWGEGVNNTYANFNQLATTPVGAYEKGKSIYGIYDMAGNVWEWVNDWYGETYYKDSPSANPLGPSSGTYRVLRGGSWYIGDPSIRSTYRSGGTPDYTRMSVGFRCARSFPSVNNNNLPTQTQTVTPQSKATLTPVYTPTPLPTSALPTQTSLPPFTALPTSTPLPTFTTLPTLTLLPTFTGIPFPTFDPFATPPATSTISPPPTISPTPLPPLPENIFDIFPGPLNIDTVKTAFGSVPSGTVIEEHILSDTAIGSIRFSLFWREGNLDLTIIQPDGNVIDPNMVDINRINMNFTSGTAYKEYWIRAPQPGAWTIRISDKSASVTGSDYMLQATAFAATTLFINFDKDGYFSGDSIKLSGSIEDGSATPKFIRGVSMQVTVENPARNQYSFELYDDGLHGDGKADDGVYANTFSDTLPAGRYNFHAQISGVNNSDELPFTREYFLSTVVK